MKNNITIHQTEIPKDSSVLTTLKTINYTDAFTAEFESKNTLTNEELIKHFFSTPPQWIEFLFELRNRFVSLFGLKVPSQKDRQDQLTNFKCEPGQKIGLFHVYSKTGDEVIMGEDDKHLNFRISFFLTKKTVTNYAYTVSTVVSFNNFTGKLYFLPVKPFHKLIVPAMIMKTIKKLIAEKNNPNKAVTTIKGILFLLILSFALFISFSGCSNKLNAKDDCDTCPKRGDTYNGNPFKKRK